MKDSRYSKNLLRPDLQMDSVDPMSSLRREEWGALGFVLVSKIEQRVFWIGIILLD